MLRDWCTWDDDYNHGVVPDVRARLVSLATSRPGYTSVLMQGSGTFGVEATVGSVVPEDGKLLVLANGGYGDRIGQIAERLRISNVVLDSGEIAPPDCAALEAKLTDDPAVTHVAVVHCETTTGILNPLADIAAVVKRCGKTFIVDAMSSFGGIPMDVEALGIDFLISSANKCIEGVPGFCFVIYPGKVSVADTFRIGTIGQVFPDDVQRLLRAIGAACYWHPENDDTVSGLSD